MPKETKLNLSLPDNNNVFLKLLERQNTNLPNATILRQKAEKHLKAHKDIASDISMDPNLLKLIQELEVSQIELEMQNEELLLAKEKAERAEKKYTELYDFAPSGYLCLSKKGEITELNFMASHILGKERSLLIEKKFGSFVLKETLSVFNQFLHNVFTSKVKQTCEIQLGTAESLVIFINIEGIVSQNNELCHLTLIDITEHKLAEIELANAKKHAEESDRLKSAFLANMSHEIRTPMNGILGFTSLLAEPELTEEKQKQYINIIEASGNRLLTIINDIIDISKIESRLMMINCTEVNINEQIEYIYTFFKPEVEAKGMKLFFKNSLPLKLSVINTDREKIWAILVNLVKNAIKYSPDGSIEFGYTIVEAQNSSSLQFFVSDTGIGIPKDRQDLIFERFIQADISNKNAFNGAGLGLSISKAYVEMLGGHIWVDSKEGKGSTFYFTIPYNIAQRENDINNHNSMSFN